MRPRLRPALLAALLVIPLLPAPGWGAARVLDYLYVDANEGGSSGGHAGVRVGDDVFHFEYRPPGILVLRREPFAEFRRHYAGLENRTIEVSRIPVSEETYRLVHDRFRRRHQAERRHLEALDSLRADRRILEELLQGTVALEGAGFFSVDDPEAGGAGDPALQALRQRVLDAHGGDFFTARREALRRRLAALDPRMVSGRTVLGGGDETPARAYEFPQRYRDTLTALVALEVLATARPLRPEATITAVDEDLRVHEDALLLARLSEGLAVSLVRLLDSRRPDWGFPLLLGLARLAALERTRASGQWVFLDAFPPPAAASEQTPVPPRAEVTAAMLRDARAEMDAARARLASRLGGPAAFPEGEFADLEGAGNRVAEIRRARAEHRGLRAPHLPLLPARSSRHAAVAAPSAAVLAASLVIAREREEGAAQALERRYRYHLVGRNCVSELVREIDTAVLGDRGAGDGSLDFIPALSTLTMGDRHGVSEVFRILSRRRAGLARLYEEEPTVRVFLRESNTITSTLYRRNPRDSVFLFFTDDAVVTRPLFGAVNLIVGAATSAAGLARLPFDGGELLWAGVRGTVFSLPELFFQNIRKGSFEYVEREAAEADTGRTP